MNKASKDKMKINRIILILSILPMLTHLFQHLIAGSFFPFLFVFVLVFIVFSLWSLKVIQLQSTVKLWALFLIGYGLTRLFLVGLVFVAESGVPSGIYYQLDIRYFLTAFFTLFVGIWIFRVRKDLIIGWLLH